MFGMGDKVRVIDGDGRVWTIIGGREHGEPAWRIQVGTDAGTDTWKRSDEVELVEKAKGPEGPAGFYPERGIMDY